MTDAIAPTSEPWDAETGGFTYDPNGNLLTTPAPYALTAASYDPWNRLQSVTKGGVVTTYRATASGHRLAQQSGGGTTEVTLREGATVLGSVTVNASGTPTVWHFNVLAGTQAVGRQPSTGSRRYYHTDLLGSVRAVVTGTTVVQSTDYDPWGVVLAGRTLSSGTKEGFTGQPRDLTTGLDEFGARTYLSGFGRWGGVDPAAGAMPEWSPNGYGLDNPIALVDGDGRCSKPPTLRPGFIGICIGQFISTKRIDYVGLGDNRGAVGDDPNATARVMTWIVLDPRTGRITESETRAERSRVGFTVPLSIPLAGTTDVSISHPARDSEGSTTFTVVTSALNGWSWAPGGPKHPINSTIDVRVSASGEVSVAGWKRDAYPSLEIYSYGAGSQSKEVIQIPQSASPNDLQAPQEQLGGKRRPPHKREPEPSTPSSATQRTRPDPHDD